MDNKIRETNASQKQLEITKMSNEFFQEERWIAGSTAGRHEGVSADRTRACEGAEAGKEPLTPTWDAHTHTFTPAHT